MYMQEIMTARAKTRLAQQQRWIWSCLVSKLDATIDCKLQPAESLPLNPQRNATPSICIVIIIIAVVIVAGQPSSNSAMIRGVSANRRKRNV